MAPNRYVDIGANLLDPMFTGNYRGKERHPSDFDEVLHRAWDSSLDKIVITAGTLEECKAALELARKISTTPTTDVSSSSISTKRIFSTVGVHPTRCNEFGETEEDLERHLEELRIVCRDGMKDGTVVALGELGLDYARTVFCDKEMQKRGFLAQLRLADETGLPLFLHNRDTGDDLYNMLKEHQGTFTRGVVHSFDGSAELAGKLINDLGLYIGLNGCSLKKQENLDVVKTIPLHRILLETDCPWCDIRATHAGFDFVKTKFPTKTEKKFEMGSCVKGRYEPCHIAQVAEVIAGVKGISVKELADACLKNSNDLFQFT